MVKLCRRLDRCQTEIDGKRMAIGSADLSLFQFEAFLVRAFDHRANFILRNLRETFLDHIDDVLPSNKSLPIENQRIFFRLMAQKVAQKARDSLGRKQGDPFKRPFFVR